MLAPRGIASTFEERVDHHADRSRGSISSARVLIDPGDVVLVELPTYTGAISAFRNAQADLVGVPQEADGIDLDGARRDRESRLRGGPPREVRSTWSRTSRTRPGC